MDRSPNYLRDNFNFLIFNNFSPLLLCKIYVFDIFNIVNFFQIFDIAKYLNSDDRIKLLAGSVHVKHPQYKYGYFCRIYWFPSLPREDKCIAL